jgi:nucleoside-diphosphate-sugar epimerase
MKFKVAITGANGFVGSHLVDQALSEGYEVVAFVRENSSLRWLNDDRVTIKHVDYLKYKSLKTAFDEIKRVDFFIHCAGVTQSKNTDDFYQGNVTVTQNLVKTIQETKFVGKKLVLISSLAARGPGENLETVYENHPISSYGKSKLMAEEVVRDSGIPNVIIRPTAVYGPRDKAFLELFSIIKRGLAVRLGSPQRLISMIHVEDLANMILQGMRTESDMITAYDGINYRQIEIIDAAKIAVNKKHTLSIPINSGFFIGLAVAMNVLYKHTIGSEWLYSTEKAKELVAEDWSVDSSGYDSFKPNFGLIDGFRQTVAWYRQEGWL